ncbi:Biotin-requiring enzyme [Spironucleus salmonicida]|uniref:Biotin-requiring enzyme n=1 Tax=Spironucleus salmonicida TaxID=348837 RepID=V6M2S6_9EUKA|nr:Biotin-requiring enzyme [Spironucleus salmonicida]|eukprot:EST47569.1 Biotin-requiring enzyme [Spironucleus salmonicida]
MPPKQLIIIKCSIIKGDKVELGARLFRIVSSKLEIVVSAKQCGILKEIHVAAGQRVVPGCLLGRLE